MLVTALLLVAAAPADLPPPQSPPAWRADLPIALVAQAPASGVDTRLVPWLGVRVARLLDGPEGNRLLLGGDVSGWLGLGPNEGTSMVKASRFSGTLEARGLLGMNALQSASAGLRPYAYLSASGGGALVTVSAFADQSLRWLPVWGLGVGAGVEVTVRMVALRVELGAGVRDGGLALTSTMAAGVAF